MRELRVNDRVKISFKNSSLDGISKEIEYDRIKVKIEDKDLELAKEIEELDELEVVGFTNMGAKKMRSSVIDKLDKFNCITIENNESETVEQRRKFVRVVCDFDLKIEKDKKEYLAKALDISACGIAIKTKEKFFKENDEVKLFLPKEIFEKDIEILGKIVKMNELNYAIAYHNLNMYNENIIMKYVFKTISQEK